MPTTRPRDHDRRRRVRRRETRPSATRREEDADLDVGALPICGEDDRLKGMLTDRDIVVKALAEGKDPSRSRPASSARASRSRSAPTTRSRRRCRR